MTRPALLLALLLSTSGTALGQTIEGDRNACNIVLGGATASDISLTCEGIPDEALEELRQTLASIDATASVMLTVANRWAADYRALEARAQELARSDALAAEALAALREGQVETARAILAALGEMAPAVARIDETTAAVDARTRRQMTEERRRYLANAIDLQAGYMAHTNLLDPGFTWGTPFRLTGLNLFVYPHLGDLDTEEISYAIRVRGPGGELLVETVDTASPRRFESATAIEQRLVRAFDIDLDFCFAWRDAYLGENVRVDMAFATDMDALGRLEAGLNRNPMAGPNMGGLHDFALVEEPDTRFTATLEPCL